MQRRQRKESRGQRHARITIIMSRVRVHLVLPAHVECGYISRRHTKPYEKRHAAVLLTRKKESDQQVRGGG
jgi:hypothetical protein